MEIKVQLTLELDAQQSANYESKSPEARKEMMRGLFTSIRSAEGQNYPRWGEAIKIKDVKVV